MLLYCLFKYDTSRWANKDERMNGNTLYSYCSPNLVTHLSRLWVMVSLVYHPCHVEIADEKLDRTCASILYHLLQTIGISILFYSGESWPFNKYLDKRILAFQSNCYRSLLKVHYTTHTPNVDIHGIVTEHIGKYDRLMGIIKKRKLISYNGHVLRAEGILTNTII